MGAYRRRSGDDERRLCRVQSPAIGRQGRQTAGRRFGRLTKILLSVHWNKIEQRFLALSFI